MENREKDFILRQIRQLAQAIERIVSAARAGGDAEAHLAAIRTAAESSLGLDCRLLDRLDPHSVPMLVPDGEAMQTLAWIAERESDIHAATGDDDAARRRRLRALALYAACAQRFASTAPACREAARPLLAQAGAEGLDERTARWLAEGGA